MSVITFLTESSSQEIQNISLLIKYANKIIHDYFGIDSSFDVLICRGGWEMEVQVLSRKENSNLSTPNGEKIVGMTDYRLGEIVIRYDAAKFGHYLHELIHSVMSKNHSHQLKEGLAWYFTERLTEHRYTKAYPPSWAVTMYVEPVRQLARIIGDDFLRDLSLGKATLELNLLPENVKELFLAEELFYSKYRYKS